MVDGGKSMMMSSSTCHATTPKLTPQDGVSFHSNIHVSCHVSSYHVNLEVDNGRCSGRLIWEGVFQGHRRSPIIEMLMVRNRKID
jgi:hypothetical protein